MQKFEKGFFIGAATAAHQVEGNNTNVTTGHRNSCPIPALRSPAALPVTIINGTKKISSSWLMPG